MIYAIDHEIRYFYDAPVVLDPLTVRLRPRSDAWQRVDAFSFEVTPEPAGMSTYVDAVGNATMRLWFTGVVEELVLAARSTVEPMHDRPFDFLLADYAVELPIEYRGRNEDLLARYLAGDAADPVTAPLVEQARASAGGQTVAFLTGLNLAVNGACRTVNRETGDPMPPAETLARGEGACRDLTRLFLAAVRLAGFAGRFVSGYHVGRPDDGRRELHAWAEVYLPGAGWRGFDPSEGQVVTDQHVWVAAGPTHADCRPTEGTYRGSGIGSRLEARVEIEPVSGQGEGTGIQTQKMASRG